MGSYTTSQSHKTQLTSRTNFQGLQIAIPFSHSFCVIKQEILSNANGI